MVGPYQALLDASADPKAEEEKGHAIYTLKPTLHSKANVTWSTEEYGHAGLQRMYLRFKSFQRFTETYGMLERAYACGAGLSQVLSSLPKKEGRASTDPMSEMKAGV